jgi:hypothetical protein
MNTPTLRQTALLLILVLGPWAACLEATRPEVKVTRKDPTVSRQTFDPRRPSPKMPKLNPPESGVCDFDFTISPKLGYTISNNRGTVVEIIVDEWDIETTLDVRIWTARGSPAKLLAHEDGHRIICEYYYQNADFIAREVAEPLIGRTFTGRGANRQAAEADATRQAIAALSDEYMNRTRVRASAAQRRYDRLTAHGTRPIGEAEAIAQIVKEDPEPSRASRIAQAEAAAAANPTVAAAPIEQFWKWNDLINRPERWPAGARLKRQVAFSDGTKYAAGTVVRVTKVTAREIDVLLPDGVLAGFGPDDTDLLDSANRAWGALNEEQRAVTHAVLARDPSVLPTSVTTHVKLNFPNVTIPAGTEVPVFDVVGNKLHVWGAAANRPMIVDFTDTDVLARARALAATPAAERPSRIASLLDGATLDLQGRPVALPPKSVYIFYRAATTCGNSQSYTSRFAERMKAVLAAHPDAALVSLAYDPADQDALDFARTFDLPGVVVPASKRPAQLEKLQVQVMPGIIVVDRHGRELLANKRYTGAAAHDATLARLETELKRMAN